MSRLTPTILRRSIAWVARQATRVLWVVAILCATVCASTPARATCQQIQLFSRQGCPHCRDAKTYLATLEARHPGLAIKVHDVEEDLEALHELVTITQDRRLAAVSVPSLRVCDSLLVGFDPERTPRQIEAALGLGASPEGQPSTVEVPFFGTLSLVW